MMHDMFMTMSEMLSSSCVSQYAHWMRHRLIDRPIDRPWRLASRTTAIATDDDASTYFRQIVFRQGGHLYSPLHRRHRRRQSNARTHEARPIGSAVELSRSAHLEPGVVGHRRHGFAQH